MNASRTKTAGRTAQMRALSIGVALGLYAALGAVSASPQQAAATAQPVSDPGKATPATVSVSGIDFKRGEGGAGRLIVRFDGDGAAPDLKTQGSSIVVDMANARLPANLQKPLNVTDFATPVQRVQPSVVGNGTRIVLDATGNYGSMAYQSGRDYIVEIVPRAAQPARAVGASNVVAGMTQSSTASSITEPTGPRVYTGRPINLNFADVSVRTVLQMIADEGGLNFVVSDSVQGNITLTLNNVPWDQALDEVLRTKGLDKRRSGNVVWIAPQDEISKYELAKENAKWELENKAELVTRYIPVNYAIAEDIAKLLTEESKSGSGGGSGGTGGQRGFLSGRGSISFDRRTNTLLVIDVDSRVKAVEALVMLLDKPVDQVVIESRIVIANENFARELGARFGISGSNRAGNTYLSGNLDANTSNRNADADAAQRYYSALDTYRQAYNTWQSQDPTTRGAAPLSPDPSRFPSSITRGLNVNLPATLANAGALALSILNAGYLLDIELSAMQVEGRGEVISNPRIVTSNQKEAVIRQGDEIGYLTLTGAGAGGGVQVPQVQFKEVLLELKVTPTITNDGRVFLNMNVKKDELSGFVDTGVGQVPRIAKREVNTAVLVDDGQTVVVGGVYEFKNNQDLSKVPFLGDIPIIGNLFKKKGRSKSKAELLIFVTPKVLRVAQRPNASM